MIMIKPPLINNIKTCITYCLGFLRLRRFFTIVCFLSVQREKTVKGGLVHFKISDTITTADNNIQYVFYSDNNGVAVS